MPSDNVQQTPQATNPWYYLDPQIIEKLNSGDTNMLYHHDVVTIRARIRAKYSRLEYNEENLPKQWAKKDLEEVRDEFKECFFGFIAANNEFAVRECLETIKDLKFLQDATQSGLSVWEIDRVKVNISNMLEGKQFALNAHVISPSPPIRLTTSINTQVLSNTATPPTSLTTPCTYSQFHIIVQQEIAKEFNFQSYYLEIYKNYDQYTLRINSQLMDEFIRLERTRIQGILEQIDNDNKSFTSEELNKFHRELLVPLYTKLIALYPYALKELKTSDTAYKNRQHAINPNLFLNDFFEYRCNTIRNDGNTIARIYQAKINPPPPACCSLM